MERRRSIDWMRGLAVLCMIEHHTFDAFLSPSLRASTWDRAFRFAGGIAAPSFLFLAGLSMTLSLSRGGSLRKAMRRAGLLLAGAYLFRFQEWALAFGASPVSDLLRIDVLNCIAISLLAVGLLWIASCRSAAAFAIAAAAVALATPTVWSAALHGLPQLASDYLRGRPPEALFPLFPWTAHAFAGAAIGIVLARIPRAQEGWLLVALAGAALFCWVLVRPSPWNDASPAVFLLRDTICFPLLALCWAADRILPRFSSTDPLQSLGRHSLLVYWVHVEIVYGRWFWRARGTLSLSHAALAVVALMLCMVALSLLREHRPRAVTVGAPA